MTKSADNLEIYQLIQQVLSDGKAVDVIEIDLHNKSNLCDAMFIATCTSSRHGAALAENLLKAFKEIGMNNLLVEGKENKGWMLVDIGDYIVHILQKDMRENYKLEELWEKQ